MIKLKNNGGLVSLEDVKQVKKTSESKGGYSCSWREIQITYGSGLVVSMSYGYDDNYHNTNNPLLDEDFKQIEQYLLKGEV